MSRDSTVTDVRGMDLRHEIRFFGARGNATGVTLYPDEATKPTPGTALNKPATVSVYFSREWDESRIASLVESQDGVRFVAFDNATKLLTFRVRHFSTYGFL